VYPIVFFDGLRIKIRDERLVKNKAVYVALAYLRFEAAGAIASCLLDRTMAQAAHRRQIAERRSRCDQAFQSSQETWFPH
jgi:Transposase, Mutator family